MFSRKRNVHVCEDCAHEWPVSEAEGSIGPLRIFLSYGHDANEELVRCIKTDLKSRKHDVWFDQSNIKAGDDWRRKITDGIVGSNRVVSFLSKHSTRDPGVCLDELAIAIGVKGGNIQTILVESETEVKPPPSIGHIQWLDMRDWKEQRAGGEEAWEAWYQSKLAEIVRVVESDESRRFAGEIETLSGHLKPISSDTRISTLLRKGFVGRTWLFEAIEEWRNASDRTSRLFWITGDPGVGKSAFAANLTHFGRDKVIAAQFVEWDKPDHRDAQRVVRSLAFQIATRLPDYRKLLLTLPEISDLDKKDPADLFDYLLTKPLQSVIGGGRERYLIVIDALDEAGDPVWNPLVDMLARNAARLPDWVGLVVTSRPESAVTTPLQELIPIVLDTRTEANRSDLRDFVNHELADRLQAHTTRNSVVDKILDKSEGVFLYVERFCEDVRLGHVSLDHPEQFPQGLGGIFFQYFQRQFPNLEKFRKDVRPALRAILAAREPLPVKILQGLFNWQDEEFRDFTRTLSTLFQVRKEVNGEVIKPYHKSLADWLTDKDRAGDYCVSLHEGNNLLADYCLGEMTEAISGMSLYALAYLPTHLLPERRWTDLLDVLINRDYLEERILSGYSKQCGSDYAAAIETWPGDSKGLDKLESMYQQWKRLDDVPLERLQAASWLGPIPEFLQHQKTNILRNGVLAKRYRETWVRNQAIRGMLFGFISLGGAIVLFLKHCPSIWILLLGLLLFWIERTFTRRRNRAYRQWRRFSNNSEALRVLLYWRLYGISDSTMDLFMSSQPRKNDWIRKAINASRNDPESIVPQPENIGPEARCELMRLIMEHWIEPYREFHRKKIIIRSRRFRAPLLLYSVGASVFVIGSLAIRHFISTTAAQLCLSVLLVWLVVGISKELALQRSRSQDAIDIKIEALLATSSDRLEDLIRREDWSNAETELLSLGYGIMTAQGEPRTH
ncbi:MAG: toll/interleukin-1 receptor domain-containing protein [Flavobacteriales bacterium]|nr:toll/interleukin-1 receptor domain-containing protein [Flavobacteriales bacterium]